MPYIPLTSHQCPGFAEELPANPELPGKVLAQARREAGAALSKAFRVIHADATGRVRLTLRGYAYTAGHPDRPNYGQAMAALRRIGADPRRPLKWVRVEFPPDARPRWAPVWEVTRAALDDPEGVQRLLFGAVVFDSEGRPQRREPNPAPTV